MRYLSTICSDVGICKKVNQDAAMVLQAKTDMGDVLFAVVCDGMGGLEKGELASATVIDGMREWFEKDFPDVLYHRFTVDAVKDSWFRAITELNTRISRYGDREGIQAGTTLTAVLIINNIYFVCNVGDSRVYYLKNGIKQITRDQSLVQQEIDMGRMTEEDAEKSNKRSILLECIGVDDTVRPEFYCGECLDDSAFLLCSDGFRHEISKEELWNELQPSRMISEAYMQTKLLHLIEVVKARQEKDNITAVLIHAQ